MKCHEKTCDSKATRIVYWPGKVPPPAYCLSHQLQAQAVLKAMGIDVATGPIEEEDGDDYTPTLGDA